MWNIWYFKSKVWRCFWYVFRTQQVCGVWLQGGPRRTPPPPYHPPPLLRGPHVSPHPSAHPHHHAQVTTTNHTISFKFIVFVKTFTNRYCYPATVNGSVAAATRSGARTTAGASRAPSFAALEACATAFRQVQ